MRTTIAGVIALVFAVFIAAGLSRNGMSADNAKDAETRPHMMVAAARDALDAVQTKYRVGQSSTEEIYRWSRRLMRAELETLTDEAMQRKTTQQHIARMLELHRRVDALHMAGAVGGEESDYNASIYYLAAAKRDLERWESARR